MNLDGILSLINKYTIVKNELKLKSESGFSFDGFDYNSYVDIKDTEIGWFRLPGKDEKYAVCGHVTWATSTVRQVVRVKGLAG